MQTLANEIIKLQLIAIPGAILLGLGLYAYTADASHIDPWLEKPNVILGHIVAGAFLLILEAVLVLRLIKRHATKLKQKNNG